MIERKARSQKYQYKFEEISFGGSSDMVFFKDESEEYSERAEELRERLIALVVKSARDILPKKQLLIFLTWKNNPDASTTELAKMLNYSQSDTSLILAGIPTGKKLRGNHYHGFRSIAARMEKHLLQNQEVIGILEELQEISSV